MTVYGENEGQGKYWNEKPGQSWVAYDASMNERLSSISDILFEDLDTASCQIGPRHWLWRGFDNKTFV